MVPGGCPAPREREARGRSGPAAVRRGFGERERERGREMERGRGREREGGRGREVERERV